MSEEKPHRFLKFLIFVFIIVIAFGVYKTYQDKKNLGFDNKLTIDKEEKDPILMKLGKNPEIIPSNLSKCNYQITPDKIFQCFEYYYFLIDPSMKTIKENCLVMQDQQKDDCLDQYNLEMSHKEFTFCLAIKNEDLRKRCLDRVLEENK